jgi:transcription elongation factor GreB
MAMSRRPTRDHKRSSYITPEGAQRLRDEHHRLWTVERPRVTREVSEAAALGDRSENAEYIYGKRRLREIDSRLEFLNKRLEELTIVEVQARDDGRVVFGAWVRISDVESGDELEYRIVGPDEFDVDAGQISMDSPVGRALLGKTAGDEVTVERPRGAATFEILAVRYER